MKAIIEMIRLEKALETVLREARPLATEKVDIQEALNRCLSIDIVTDTDVPSFSKSAMDGFAIQKEDLFNDLEMIEYAGTGVAMGNAIEPLKSPTSK